jgi:polyferredoxin
MKIQTNPFRLVIQVSVLILILLMITRVLLDRNYVADFEAYCPYGGIMAFVSFLVNKSLACSMTSVQVAMGAVLILAIILLSKLFCSYICPAGSVSEWLGKLGEKLRLRFTVTGYADILLRGIKYAILYITVFYTVKSSELFCRKFDPFYASVTGFSADVSLLWGIIAIIAVVAGSVFIRLFWCKYLCPLGAVSNIFSLFLTFLTVTGLYAILLYLGISLNFTWPLAIICSAAYFIEFYSLRTFSIPLLKVTRNPGICTNCKICSSACPQGIDVASVADVRHIDCHMCADCIHVCPEKGALTINHNGKKWLPALVLVVLITAGIIAGSSFELPTISLYWGDISLKKEMKVFTRSGIKSVKCYGTSTAFADQMKLVKGVTGVTTFVKTNTVRLLYNPAEIDSVAIIKAIYTPAVMELKEPGKIE